MELNEIREVYARLRRRQQGIGPTIDRDVSLAQVELLCEIATQLSIANQQLSIANQHLARINILNFEEMALRLDALLKAKEGVSHDGS